MKSKVILYSVLLFCSKIVDAIPHSENHVRQRVDPPSNWQVNKNVPNAQYVNTDFTHTRNVNKLTNTATQQENNEDYYLNQRGYNYDSNGYNEGSDTSSSAKKLLVNYDSPADGRRLDSYPPRVKSYPSHTSQDGFDHQQYRNQEWRSQNPFTNSVPSSVLIPNNERPLVTFVEEPYRVAQYLQPNHATSSNRRVYHPERPSHTSEQYQYLSGDHSGDNKYVVNPTTRLRSSGPYENYRQGQASEIQKRPTRVHRYAQNFETSPEIKYETPAVESVDALADQSGNTRYSVDYEKYREGQVSETKTSLTGIPKHVQNYKTSAVETLDTLVDQSENIRYPVPYENYREGQVSETKTSLTGVPKHVKNPKINYKNPTIQSPDTLVDQSENTRYPVLYENYREDQVSETKPTLTGVRKLVQNTEIKYETPTVESLAPLVGNENYRENQVSETKPTLTGVRKLVQNSEINYETPAVESPDTLVDQSENTRYPAPYENYREGQVSETKRRPTRAHRYAQNFGTPFEINNETPAVKSPDILVDESRNPVRYENYRKSQASETKRRLTGVHKLEHNFETPSEINYESPDVESADTLVDQSENTRYPVPYENYREGQVSETKRRLNGIHVLEQNFEIPSEIIYEIPDVESPDMLVDQSENIRYPVPYENYREGQVPATKRRLTGVRKLEQNFETPSKIIYETPAVESPDHLVDQSENIKHVQTSRTRSHLSDSATITSETDNYSSDSRLSNHAPVGNVKKEATVEIRRNLDDNPVARKNAHGSDYGWNDAPTDITETVEVKAGKYGVNYAEEKAVPLNIYPEDSLTPTKATLEKSGTFIHEESHVPQFESSSPNYLKPNTIHHLTSEIKELSLKSLVANPEIQHILSRTDKRYIVVHPNRTIEYLDTLPLDSQQDSKLRLVHTKRKNIDGSEGDGPLTPQWPQNLPSNIAKAPAPVDEYPWPTKSQPADEYDSHHDIPLENLPAGHSHSKPLVLHAEQPAYKESSKPRPPPVNESADGGYSKPWNPNEDQPVDDSHLNQHQNDDNSKILTPNEAQPAYNGNPKPTLKKQSGNNHNSNPLPHYVNNSTDDGIWTFPENKVKEDDNSKSSLTDVNKSKDEIHLTPYAIKPELVKRHEHVNVTHPENDKDFKPLPPDIRHPAHHKPILYRNHHEKDDNSNSTSENQPADKVSKFLHLNEDDTSPVKQPEDDKIAKRQLLKKYQSEDDTDAKLILPHLKLRVHHNVSASKLTHVNKSEHNNNSNPVSPDENNQTNFNISKPLPLNEDDKQNENDTTIKQTVNEIDNIKTEDKNVNISKPLPLNEDDKQKEDDDENNDIGTKSLSPPKKSRARHNKSKPKSHLLANEESDEENSNSSSEDENKPEDKNVNISKPLPLNENDKQKENDTITKQTVNEKDNINYKPLSPPKKPRASHNKSKPTHLLVNEKLDEDNSNSSSKDKNKPDDKNVNISKPLPLNDDDKQKEDDTTNKTQTVNENDDIGTKPLLLHKKSQKRHKKSKPKLHLLAKEESDEDNSNSSSKDENKSEGNNAAEHLSLNEDDKQKDDDTTNKPKTVNENDDIGTKPLSPHKNPRTRHNKSKPKKHLLAKEESDDDNSNSPSQDVNQTRDNNAAEPLLYVSSENVDESKFKTLSPNVPSYSTTPKSQAIKKHKRKHRHRKSTKNSPVESTTPSQNDSIEDQIITLSPIEQVTDNVSDVPTLTTTTAKPVDTPDKKKTFKAANNKPDETQDDTKSSSEDQGRYEEKEDKAVISIENNEKHNTQTAVYNSSELLDTTTDVPEETDDYSPVIPPLSVQNDVHTGDTSGDSSSELEQSETDVTITVSSSTTYDSEGDIITINIEVSESTDSSSNDKTLVVSIDTHPDNDDDSKALETDVIKITKTEDCKDDHDHDDGRGKNVEFDLSNLQEESTIWIKQILNQDFIDKLTSKNDTQFDVIYFFSIENRPTIEIEKETTIFCNGTVVIETTEITYAHEDDPIPTIVKATEIMEIEDYELNK